MAGEPARKRVGIRLPRHVTPQSTEQRWTHELEALAPIADIIEIHADTPAEFAAAAGDLDAIITSWGIRIDQEIIGALKRWTWLYYVTLVLLGLGLLSLPLNLANLVTGRVVTSTASFAFPTWYLYVVVGIGLLGAGLFVWMLIAMIRYGPWAMRRVPPA